jgi:uncharacterized protein
MRARTALGLFAAGLVGAGLYATRRRLLARALGLRPPEYTVTMRADRPVTMPDGVILYADHFAPQSGGPFPTILIRTPYGRPSETRLLGALASSGARLFAERGYNVIVQSVRGRFRSQGRFEPFLNEAADGRATLDWIAAQPWFEGNLGMWGLSYLGYTQWAVAADAPPFLKAIVPIVSTARFSHAFYPGGAFAYETCLRWISAIKLVHNPGGALNFATLLRALDPQHEATLRTALVASPFASADQAVTGETVPFFQQWLADPDPDGPYWSRVDHHRKLNRISAAIHLVAGWYDIFLPEQLADYTDLLAANQRPALTILPRYHNQTALPFEAVREGLWWFDAHLKGQHELLERRAVRLALMGAHEWHSMDFWPPPATPLPMFLHAGGQLSTTPPGDAPPSRFRHDPSNPVPSRGGPVLSPQGGPRDQRPIEARPDLLCFTSEPLAHDLDVIGYVRLELFAQASLPDHDLVGRLCVVEADGRSINICEGLLRVGANSGESQPNGSRRFSIDLAATARRFRAGQRMRLHICGAAHPRWSVNSGDGRPLDQGAPAGPQLEQSVFHDSQHPSALILPIVSDETRRAMAGER